MFDEGLEYTTPKRTTLERLGITSRSLPGHGLGLPGSEKWAHPEKEPDKPRCCCFWGAHRCASMQGYTVGGYLAPRKRARINSCAPL